MYYAFMYIYNFYKNRLQADILKASNPTFEI